jgi:hypothetical protein
MERAEGCVLKVGGGRSGCWILWQIEGSRGLDGEVRLRPGVANRLLPG